MEQNNKVRAAGATVPGADVRPQHKQNGFVRFLKAVFVHNWALKLSAIGIAVLGWFLVILAL